MRSPLTFLIASIPLLASACNNDSGSGLGPVLDPISPPAEDLDNSSESIAGVLTLRDEHTGATRVLGLVTIARDPHGGSLTIVRPLVQGR